MKVMAITYKQGNSLLLSTVLTVGQLRRLYHIPRFGEVPFGYQRHEEVKHVQQIRQFILGQETSPMLPTAIILGAYQEDLIGLDGQQPSSPSVVELTLPDAHVLRVIDGQHRILGFEQALERNRDLADYPLPVNILVIPRQENPPYPVQEIETFININSKSKRIKTDLAILIRYQLQVGRCKTRAEFVEYICTRVGYLMNADEKGVWSEAITVDPSEPAKILSISAWNRSIQGMVSLELTKSATHDEQITPDLCNQLANDLKRLLDSVWSAVQTEWPQCFLLTEQTPRYDKTYLLQRAIGVNAVHLFLTALMEKGINGSLEAFIDDLRKSPITAQQWKMGGEFSGYNSQSGFKQVAKRVFPSMIRLDKNR